ncbi:MAG: aspartyl protease family protein [Planctomycetota bacterium]|jgi:predicted aspartyl protease
MNRFSIMVLSALMATIGAGQPDALGTETNVFVLKRTPDGFIIEAVPVVAGTVQVFQCGDEREGAGDGVVDVIFPPGPGRSAGLIDPADRHMLVVRHTGEALRIEAQAPDGSKRQFPPRSIADLAAHDIRVNVTGGGDRAAFLIERNETVRRDVGPVANMFTGRVPPAMLEAAYVVETETYRHHPGTPVSGLVPLEIDRWPFVKVTLPNGTQSDFIVDIGAASTIVDRSLLPEDADISKASMVEYSAAGKRTLKYAPGGATGSVQTVIGQATLPRLTLGDVAIPEVTVDVLARMPDLFGRPVGGILGLDIMRRCDRLTLALRGDAAGLQFDAPPTGVGDAIELPFAFVSTHLAVRGAVQGTPVYFILDSGAPTTFLDEPAADAVGVTGDASEADEARGLDEGSVRMIPGIIGSLELDGRRFENVPCRISALAAFETLRGENQHIGLLGNDFFARFDRIEIDFAGRVVRFVD